jgi:hypothetical protein
VTIARSIARPIASPIASRSPIIGGGGGEPEPVNLLSNGTFDADESWSKGAGWSIGSGVASFAATGSSSNLSQGVTLEAGATYRLTYTLTRSAGNLQNGFTGGSSVFGTTRSASGTYSDDLTAVSGNTSFRFVANSTFAGTVDNVTLVRL